MKNQDNINEHYLKLDPGRNAACIKVEAISLMQFQFL